MLTGSKTKSYGFFLGGGGGVAKEGLVFKGGQKLTHTGTVCVRLGEQWIYRYLLEILPRSQIRTAPRTAFI